MIADNKLTKVLSHNVYSKDNKISHLTTKGDYTRSFDSGALLKSIKPPTELDTWSPNKDSCDLNGTNHESPIKNTISLTSFRTGVKERMSNQNHLSPFLSPKSPF